MFSLGIPAVNSQFSTSNGELFTVIGTGTQGVVVEYSDGRVELISAENWQYEISRANKVKQH